MNRNKADREIYKLAKYEDVYTDNVKEFTQKMALEVAVIEAMNFQRHMEICVDDFSSSPIEALFYIAYRASLIRDVYNTMHGDLFLYPQYQIGKYRCDFLMVSNEYKNKIDDVESSKDTKIIIELDGHYFHDKNEKQRREEKKRDRFLQSKGFKVLRFTGKEVTDNPCAVFHECLKTFIGYDGDLYEV